MSTFVQHMLFSIAALFISALAPMSAIAETPNSKIGIVLMHGKGSMPSKGIDKLAMALDKDGFIVENLEMPWSGKRDYNATAETAEAEVVAALTSLRSKGAEKVFIAGHSFGGGFALYFGTKHVVDGIIPIAPGGNAAMPIFQEKLGEYVEHARKLIADGKGSETTRLMDHEGKKGTYPIITTPASYLSWFDPEGVMNGWNAVKNMNPATPVLFIVPKHDYPPLLKIKQELFDGLPENPHTRLYEPNSDHVGAIAASTDEIIQWIGRVVNTQ